MDLKPFCSKYRPYLHEPWSRDAHTYAANGYIAARVPRRDDVSENPKAPACERLFDKIDRSLPLRSIPHYDVPEPKATDCSYCHGRCHEHDCPDCSCECEYCDGLGRNIASCSVALGPGLFAARYIQLLATLPGILIAPGPDRFTPAYFTFDGGDGLIMPMTREGDTHVPEPQP